MFDQATSTTSTDGALPTGRDRRTRTRLWTAPHVGESLAVLFIGVALMHFFYAGTGGITGDELGVPGNDSFYHIKMSAMLPQWGFTKEFPWLQYAYFTDEGHAFVSHHYGFHVLMLPFVQLSHYLNGDYLAGGRWATTFFFGVTVMLFNLLLISENVPWRWFWLFFFLVMPIQFFTRHAFARAITPSLLFMLLTVLFMFRGRYILAGLAVLGFTHLYLGGVMYAPVVVALYAASVAFGPRGDREIPWKLVLATFAGWLIGILTYPYSEGMWEFLRLQVFGSGLTPDIPVGQEWQPYQDLWWFAQMIGPTAIVCAAAVAMRLRLGPPLNARELSLLLMNFAFLVLLVKARRFVEYWPVFALLTAAYLSAPQLRAAARAFDAFNERSPSLSLAVLVSVVVVAMVVGGTAYGLRDVEALAPAIMGVTKRIDAILPFLADWRAWAALAAAYALAPLTAAWFGTTKGTSGTLRTHEFFIPLLAATIAIGILSLLAWTALPEKHAAAKLPVGWSTLAAVAALYVIVASLVSVRTNLSAPWMTRLARTAWVGAVVVFVVGGASLAAGDQILEVQRSSRCQYDLPAIRRTMKYITEHSNPGDVIFTDDWDVFPVYFYHNTHNYYIVGLDPKFTHERDPERWQRYVKVSRGEIPTDTWYTRTDRKTGKEVKEKIHVRLEDIRDHFHCKFVITDRDHKQLAGKLAAARHFAELVFPVANYDEARDAPYVVFRIREPGESPQDTSPPPPNDQGILYLSLLTPQSVSQGWGDFTCDRSVGGGPIQPGAEIHLRGLGTHAPSKLVYEIPPGYDYFESTVGVNRSTKGAGSVTVSVSFDDAEPALVSNLITGNSDPLNVRVGVGQAKRITLQANPTPDGNRFDHVDWADARFVKSR